MFSFGWVVRRGIGEENGSIISSNLLLIMSGRSFGLRYALLLRWHENGWCRVDTKTLPYLCKNLCSAGQVNYLRDTTNPGNSTRLAGNSDIKELGRLYLDKEKLSTGLFSGLGFDSPYSNDIAKHSIWLQVGFDCGFDFLLWMIAHWHPLEIRFLASFSRYFTVRWGHLVFKRSSWREACVDDMIEALFPRVRVPIPSIGLAYCCFYLNGVRIGMRECVASGARWWMEVRCNLSWFVFCLSWWIFVNSCSSSPAPWVCSKTHF